VKDLEVPENIGLEDTEVPLEYRSGGPIGTLRIQNLSTYRYPLNIGLEYLWVPSKYRTCGPKGTVKVTGSIGRISR